VRHLRGLLQTGQILWLITDILLRVRLTVDTPGLVEVECGGEFCS